MKFHIFDNFGKNGATNNITPRGKSQNVPSWTVIYNGNLRFKDFFFINYNQINVLIIYDTWILEYSTFVLKLPWFQKNQNSTNSNRA